MIIDQSESELIHYGTPRRSGRYPWGSGKDPQQSGRNFLGYYADLKSKGLNDTQIAEGMGMSTTELRARRSIAKTQQRQADAAHALKLKDSGMSNVAIGREMGINESSVRALLDPAMADRRSSLENTANLLRSKVDEVKYLDIGSGTENHLNISATKLATAVALLKEEGYVVHNIQVDQQGTSGKTTVKVLAPPGTTYLDVKNNKAEIKTVAAYSNDGMRTYQQIQPPRPVDPKRVAVRYAEQGGSDADGVIYIRPGVPDISLGASRYAQVRIAVGDGHYLKGMAVYHDDLPRGVDLLFNTNKSDTGNKLDAMKALKNDADSPFGAIISQRHYLDGHGNKQLSAINIVNEEGNWSDWSRNLSSQFLSKQKPTLAKRQLDTKLAEKKDEFDEIMNLTNPVVKKKLLQSFADSADSAAVNLKAASLPGQATHVILPIQSLSSNEIHAPYYKDGTRVALVRFPHGGTFEIPELTVNNRNAEAKKTIGPHARDAVGIHPNVAARLSGADFDGDTVLVIPNNKGEVTTQSALKNLKGFDPKTYYPPYDGMKTIDGGTWSASQHRVVYPIDPRTGEEGKGSGRAKQQQMGDVSNLVTDMTIKGAKPDELARAVRHSMVVIDAEKHSLNVKQSYVDNGIPQLKEIYQGRGKSGRLSGASTIVSRAGAEIRVRDRKPRSAAKGGPIDPITGNKVWEDRGEEYVNRKGKTVVPTTKSQRLAEVKDAFELVSDSPAPIEVIYAEHSNKLKALANQARLEYLKTPNLQISPTARITYAPEVKMLNHKLNIALQNRPLERQAQLIADAIVSAKRQDNPGMDNSDLKKIKGQALNTARARVGAGKRQIVIEPREWEAIQAGAISSHRLSEILDNTDVDKIKEYATPRTMVAVSPAKLERAKLMLAGGYTQADVAAQLGVSPTTLARALKYEGSDGG